MNPEKRGTYLVTGGSGSIGRAVVNRLAEDGHTVFAGDIACGHSPEDHDGGRIVPLHLDVTNEKSVRNAELEVRKRLSGSDFTGLNENGDAGLDGIINIAGIFRTAALVEAEEALFSTMMETNVAGMYRVNRIFFDLLYRNRGRVVTLSSETARFSVCFNGLYSMTKYAVEAYSDALRRELQLYGMKVIIVRPGPVMTPLLLSNRSCFCEAAERSTYFKPQLEKIAGLVDGEQRKAVKPEVIARVVCRALYTRNPRLRYTINNDLSRRILAALPPKIADKLFYTILKK